MNKYYKCSACGNVIEGKYKERPNPGSYYLVRCKCGNKGNSAFVPNYDIKGFEQIKHRGEKNGV